MAGLQDLLQGAENAIGGAAQGVGNFVNNDIIHPVEQVFQPQQIQAPIPQNHPMFQAPPIQNFTDWLGNQAQNVEHAAGNAIQSGTQAVGNYFNPNNVGSAGNPTPNFWTTPVAQGLANVQQFDQNAPKFDFAQTMTQGMQNPVEKFVAQTALGVPQSILNAPSDILRAGSQIGNDINSGQITQPTTAIRDAAGAAMPLLTIGTLGGGTVAKGIAENVGKEAGYEALGQAMKEGAITGGKWGGVFGVLNGLASSNNLPTQLSQAAQQGVSGALTGIAAGGLLGGASNRIGAIKNSLMQVLQDKYGATPEQAAQGVTQFARDELGRFTGIINDKNAPANLVRKKLGISQNEPVFYGDLRKSLGLPEDGNYQAGFIKPSAFVPGMEEAPETNPKANVTDVTPQDFSPLTGKISEVSHPLDLLKGETPDQARARKVGYQIDNGIAKLENDQNGWTGTVTGTNEQPHIIRGYQKQQVINEMYKELYPNYGAIESTLPIEQKEIPAKPSLKEQLQQPPLPPKMSSKAITEGLEAPQTGRDISVSPQAAIRYRIAKNAGVKMTMGNPEPLPWENGSEPAPLSDEWIKQRALPTTPADAGLPPKEDQPVIKISNKENPVKITNPNGTVRDARAEMDTAKTQIQARGRVVQQLVKDAIDKAGVPEEGGNATNTGANKLFRVAIEHPENEPDILTQVKNPVQFKQALDQFREFTGFNLKAAQDAGAKLKGLKGYYSHIWDLSDPEKAAEFQQLSKASAQNYKGWYNKPRVFKDIAEGESYGFRLKNKNVANDVAEYTNAFAKEQGARVLSNRLVSDFPDKAVILNQGDPTPIDMKQSDIPGAKGLFTSQDIKDQLKDLEPHEKTGLGVKIISNINNIDKQVRLGGGLFHIQNTGLDYLASQVGLGRFPRLITAARTFLDPAFYADYMRGAINDGTIDKMAKANVSLDTEQDFSGKQTGVSKLSKNPLTALNDATFKRLENFFKTEAFRALDNKGLIDTSTPQGVKVAQQYGREINNMFGGQNRVVGDDIFKSSVGRFTSHFGLLAPDYQQGRFKHTFSALGIGNGGGFNPLNRTAGNNYAAYTLALRVAITAMAAEGLRRALTGKFNPNLISVVKNDLLDPNFPTPWQNTSTNGTKENEIAHMPASNLSDWYRAISDPQQFAISHLGAGLSDATAFISNKDYFGNTISQTNNPVEKLFKIGLNDAPIPVVQAGKVISGRVPIGNAIINELGDRVSLDPNDPMALFYAGQKQAMNNLLSKTPDPKMQNALTSGLTQLQSVGALNPNDPRRKQVEYTTYTAFPQLFQVNQQAALAQAGGDPTKADPLYSSPYANEYLEYEQVSSSAPGSSEEKDYLNQHPELIPLIQARGAFYQAHPIAQNPNAPAYIPAPQPNSYVQQQLAAKNYTDPQVQAYLTAHGQYVNNQRQAIGLPMLNSFGQNPMEAAKSNASYQRNQMMSLSRKLKYINKESKYQSKKFIEKNANVNKHYARIRSEAPGRYSARKVAYSPLQNSHYRIVAPPTVKKAGYKAAFKAPANIKYPTLTIG